MTQHRASLRPQVVRMEVEPKDLLEEVHAQLGIAGAWMTESGIFQRCRLAASVKEVAGALIELERRGKAVSQNRDTARALWRIAAGRALPAPPEIDFIPPRDAERPAVGGVETPASAAASPPHGAHPRAAHDQAVKQTAGPREGPFSTTSPHSRSSTMPRGRDNNTRQRILERILKGAATVGTIAEDLDLDGGVVSYHVRNLLNEGLARRQDPKNRRSPICADRSAETMPGAGRAPKTAASPPPTRVNGQRAEAGLRWFLGSDGGVRIEVAGTAVELAPAVFDRIQRAREALRSC